MLAKSSSARPIALLAAGVAAVGLALVAPSADAAGARVSAHRAGPAAHAGSDGALTRAQLADVRARQHQMVAAHRVAPTVSRAATKTFTVTTTQDTELADPAGTTCVDADGKCSLRAAVAAANNLGTPVQVVLGKHTYLLGSAITVTDPQGVTIVGAGSGKTVISGGGVTNMFVVTYTSPRAGQLTLSSLKLTDGSATQGGAIYLNYTGSGVTLVLDHVTATGNTATSAGGVVYASDYAGVYLDHSTFSDNHAPSGGVVFSYWSDVHATDSTFTHNGSTPGSYGEGGVFFFEYGVASITGGSISDNSVGDATTGGEGGAIYDEYAMETLTGVHVDRNVAGSPTAGGSGGAFIGYENQLEVNGGSFSHNRAYGSGGALNVFYQNQVALHGVTMAGNQANLSGGGNGGGAVYAYGETYPTQLVIDQHSKITGANAAALYLEADTGSLDASIVDSTLANNTDDVQNGYSGYGCGGAVCAFSYEYGSLNLELQGNAVTGNSSAGNYGAGAVTAYAGTYGGLSAQLRHNSFSKNVTGASGWGGAVGFFTPKQSAPISVRMAANSFTHNKAGTQASPGSGGALSAYYTVTVSDTGSTFSGNRAIGSGADGGAVFVSPYPSSTNYGTTSWKRTRFTGNSAGTNNAANYGNGGAFYSNSYAGDSFDQVTMSGNKAASYGGGYFADDYTYQARITDSTFSGNTAGTSQHAGYGGGAYVADAVLTVDNSTFTGNQALSHGADAGQGGAIFHGGSRMDMRYTTVSGNLAKQGGGIFSYANGGSLLSSIVSANRVSTHGAESDCATGVDNSQLDSLGGNVLGQAKCVRATKANDKVTKNPRLLKLKSNGGPTQTMALLPKSAAVGRATFQIPAHDQRGHARPSKNADSGAYELPKQH